MTSRSAHALLNSRDAVYIIAAIAISGGVIAVGFTVPDVVSGYASNGLMLPAYRYGLLFSLIACGVIISSERSTIALVANLAILVVAYWFGVQRAGEYVLLYQPLAALIVTYPVLTPVMGLATGAILLLPLRAIRWLIPIAAAICGVAAGLFVVLESPPVYTYFNGWFSLSAGFGCMAVVVASMALSDAAERTFAGSGLAIARRIFGSWLIAASLMLAALAIMPQRPRVLDATNLPPVQQRKVGDVVSTPTGARFLWTGQGWERLN